MPEIIIRDSHVVLDACCIINLAPTGEFDSILSAIPTQFVVASYVLKQEVLSYVDMSGQEIPFDLSGIIQNSLILEVDIDYSQEDEPNYVVTFAAQNLDAGEADSAAIAINRGWAIATDDRRAIKVISQTSPKTQIVTTPELMKFWVDKLDIPETRVKQAVKSIRKYAPPNSHPLINWWKKYLE